MNCEKMLQIDLSKFDGINLNLPAAPQEYINLKYLNATDFTSCTKEVLDFPFAKSPLIQAKIKQANVITSGEDVKKVYELLLDISGNDVDYQPGETIGVPTRNLQAEVNLILDRLELHENADKLFELEIREGSKKSAKIPKFIPQRCTIRQILEEYVDIRCVPKKLFIRALSVYTTAENDRKLLDILSSKEGTLEYENVFLHHNTNLIDILREIKSCCPPFSVLIEHLPRLMPRPYSIASSRLVDTNTLRILFSIFEPPIIGLTTTLLEESIVNKKAIKFYFRTNTIYDESGMNLNKNLIMIGAGTGVAPFIGIIEHRKQLKQQTESNETNGTVWLLTGQRYSRSDGNIFAGHFKSISSMVDKHFQSFSRDPNTKMKYVQDIIVTNQVDFVELFMDASTCVYICGEGKTMAPDIERTIIECLINVKGLSIEEAKTLILDRKKNKSYVEDVWF